MIPQSLRKRIKTFADHVIVSKEGFTGDELGLVSTVLLSTVFYCETKPQQYSEAVSIEIV